MRKINWIGPAFLTLSLLLFADAFGQAQHRKWAEPDGVPLFDLRRTITVEERNAQDGLVRAYLWRLWKTRTKGYFRVRSYTLEGDVTNCLYLVEPRKAGGWRVVSTCKESVCPYISKARCRKFLKPHVESYDEVERRESGYSAPTTAPSIPDDQRISPIKFVLLLKNSVSGALFAL